MLCALAASGNAHAQIPAATRSDVQGETPLLLAMVINGETLPHEYLIIRRGTDFLIQLNDLNTLRLRRPSTASVDIDGAPYIPLSAIPGLIAVLDDARQLLQLTVPAEAFRASAVSAATPLRKPTDATLAAYLNYDVTAERGGGTRLGAYLDAGISDDWGLVSSTAVIGQGAVRGDAMRLDSYYMRDDPTSLTRLVVGDSVTDAREWTRQIRFGGVRLGTEFGLQPDLVTFPTPAFAGRASVPSNVELLVNDAARFQADVDQGPFSINQVPLVTGAGEVTLVVRNPLGMERRVRQRYYVSARLLRQGLDAWSLEGGWQRRNYGLRSFSYHAPFAAGTYRRGLTEKLTIESRAAASGDMQMLGGGIIFVMPVIGEFSLAGAASRSAQRTGLLYRVGYSRITPHWNVAIHYQHSDTDYRELGDALPTERITRQLQASGGLSLGQWGSLGGVYTDLRYADGKRARVGTATYSASISDSVYFNLFAIRTAFRDIGRRTTLGASVTVPLGDRGSAYVQADNDNAIAEVRRTPPTSGGWGYRATLGLGQTDRQQAEVQWRGEAGELNVQAARFESETGFRATASGGLLWAGGTVRPTRQVRGAFGVVEVPGEAGVRVYQENREVGRTGSDGRAIIADLIPYEENRITIAPADLPIEAQMATDRLTVIPRYRSAVLARFAVEHENPGTILIAKADGKPVEAGTSVRAGDEQAFIGYDGTLFLRDIHEGMIVEVDSVDGRCRVRIDHVPADTVLPRIGPLPCRRDSR